MTALCGGGPSQAIPGFNQTVVTTAAAIEGALILFGFPEVAAILGPIIAPAVYDLTTFCTTDPPADPGLTNADLRASYNWTSPLDALAAQAKIRQWFLSRYWYQVCECSSVATPAPPALSNPGTISTNPGLPTAPSGAKCWDGTQIWPYNPPFQVILDNVLLWADGEPLHNNSGVRYMMKPLPTQVKWTATYNPSGATPADNVFIQVDWSDIAGHVIRTDKTGITDSPPKLLTRSLTMAPPAGTDHVQFGAGTTGAAGGSPTGSITVRAEVWCDGQSPSTPASPCCPPDPIVEQKLSRLEALVTAIYQSLPAPLHSYSSGTAHVGLSGHGTITLSAAALGVRVDITSDPVTLGSELGSPMYLPGRGYIVPIVNAAPIRSEMHLVYNPQTFQLPTLTEQIGYSLHPGVVVTITELMRGP